MRSKPCSSTPLIPIKTLSSQHSCPKDTIIQAVDFKNIIEINENASNCQETQNESMGHGSSNQDCNSDSDNWASCSLDSNESKELMISDDDYEHVNLDRSPSPNFMMQVDQVIHPELTPVLPFRNVS